MRFFLHRYSLLVLILLIRFPAFSQLEDYRVFDSLSQFAPAFESNSCSDIPGEEKLSGYLKNRLLIRADTIFLSYTDHMQPVQMAERKNAVEFTGYFAGNVPFSLEFQARPLDTSQLVITYKNSESCRDCIETIDSIQPFGTTYSLPEFQLSEIRFVVDGKQIPVDPEVYRLFFEPRFCFDYDDPEIAAYLTQNRRYLYVYLTGGLAADTYTAKLIFNTEGHQTSWILDYYIQSCFGLFHGGCKGF